MQIQQAAQAQIEEIKNVYEAAFDAAESQAVYSVAQKLLNEKEPVAYSFIATDEENKVIGHISFSAVSVDANANAEAESKSESEHAHFILAPLAVHLQFQKQGVGSALCQHGLQHLQEISAGLVFVYGDPAYYSKFGFDASLAQQFIPPYTLQFPHGWQALNLSSHTYTDTHHVRCVEALSHADLW